MIEIKNKERCSGCSACYNICPVNAIEMIEDHEGFKYPKVNKDKCINCGLCEKVCPFIKKVESNNDINPKVFAAWSNDEHIRLDSTSGGIFSELAKKVYAEQGYVCATIYDEDWNIKHYLSDNIKDLDNLRSSKYAQSDVGFNFKLIKEKLDENKKVLFCGTPCQVYGLINYLKKDYPNLIIVDFICRGINSPKVFKEYINNLERKYNSKVVKVKFKNKTYGWHNFSTKIDFENGESYIKSRYLDTYMIGYLKYNAFMRPCCYNCHFKSLPRRSDITLADFWGIESIDPKMDQDKGTSMVLINSKKGEKLFKSIENNLVCKEIFSQSTFKGNINTFESPEKTINRENVFKNIDKMSYEELSNNFFPSPNIFVKEFIILKHWIKRSKFGKLLISIKRRFK